MIHTTKYNTLTVYDQIIHGANKILLYMFDLQNNCSLKMNTLL